MEARRWINATVVNMYDEDDPETLKPIIDGGTEGALLAMAPSCKSHVVIHSLRLQRPISYHPPKNDRMLRMFPRYANETYNIPHVHHCEYPTAARTLYRMGIRIGMAQGVSW